MQRDRKIGNNIYRCLCMHTELLHTPPLECCPIPANLWKANIITHVGGYEATSHQAVLQAKMAELQDLVEAHIAESAHRQKVHYDRHSEERHFKAGDLV